MLRGKERSKEPELEEIDLETLELESVGEPSRPHLPVVALPGPAEVRVAGTESWSRAREALAAIQRDLDAVATANDGALRAAESRANELGKENEELRSKLQEAERRIGELEAFKRNLKQILDQ